MPQGQSTSGTASYTPANSALTSMFTSLFGGQNGAGATGVNSLSSIASGQNITQLNSALTASNKSTLSSSISNLKEAFGSTGMGSSSALGKVIGQTVNQNANNLTTNLAGEDLTAQGQTLSASNYLSQIFSQSANQYFQTSSTGNTTMSAGSDFGAVFSTLFPGGL